MAVNPSILQVIGSILLAVGIGMMWLPAGVAVAGVMALLFGVALERRS